jgi:biotin carboxylase
MSENAASAQAAIDADFTWLGPTPSVIKSIRLKHLAREVAMEARVICVPWFHGTRLRRDGSAGGCRADWISGYAEGERDKPGSREWGWYL